MTLEEMNAFNAEWLQAWTDKDIGGIVSMYAEDCLFMDAATAGGLQGRAALRVYLEALFPRMPEWTYGADELWEIPGGFCARWFCDMGPAGKLRGFDFVQLRGHEIARNEVYTHNL